MFKSILILITCAIVIFFGTIFIQSTVYAPTEINMTYEGFYFDFDNAELKQNVNVSVNGSITKDTWLQPKAFTGTITIDSLSIEIVKPMLFSKLGRNYHLYLPYSETDYTWKINSDSFLKQYSSNANWGIFMNKKFTNITFVPSVLGRGSTERIAAPCNNREDAMAISRMLLSSD